LQFHRLCLYDVVVVPPVPAQHTLLPLHNKYNQNSCRSASSQEARKERGRKERGRADLPQLIIIMSKKEKPETAQEILKRIEQESSAKKL
jgi:hypothetical protein